LVEDPEGTLQGLGVDTSGLEIREVPNESAPFEAFASQPPSVNGCVTIGCIVCGSVG
jgi:hypothetical protein